MSAPSPLDLDPARVRERFAAAFRPRPVIFWVDLLASAALGWTAFGFAWSQPVGSAAWLVCLSVAVLALLRAALFIHELAHLKRRTVPGFALAWHALVGLPLLLPSLMYVGSHGDHHRRAAFGTEYDPEYAPLAHWSRWRLLRFVLVVAVVPLLLPIRWGVMAPLSYLLPRFRRLVVERASTLVINPDYRRPLPRGKHVRRWLLQELAACAICWAVFAGWWQGLIPVGLLGQWYVVGAGILIVNQVRTLVAHGYENEGEQVDAMDQVLDSINLHGVPVLTALIAPVGMRYHALHHFLPAVPYHSLGQLHRLLRAELPLEAAYHRTERAGVLVALLDLLRRRPASEELSVPEVG